MSGLIRKLKDTLPVNVSVSQDDVVESVRITIVRDDGCILEKTVSDENVLYTYRNKTIASFVADALELHGREEYYHFVEKLLDNPEHESDVLNVSRTYLPAIGEGKQ